MEIHIKYFIRDNTTNLGENKLSKDLIWTYFDLF